MKLTDLDQKVLTDLGLDKLSEDQKQTILEKLDKALLNRFIAKLLTSVPKDKYPELEKALEKADKGEPEKFFEEAINLHPDAKKVLEESTKEVIEEFKKNQEGADRDTARKGNEPKLSELKPKPLGKPESPTPTDNPPPPITGPQPLTPDKSPDTQQPTPNQSPDSSSPNARRPTPDEPDYYQAG